MRDVELYRQVLGLEAPWTVTRVELSVTEERVDVWAGHAARVRWPCPTCGTELPVYDHAAERAWRHLDTCQFVTYLHARPPRVACPDHGVRQVRLPWAEPHERLLAQHGGALLSRPHRHAPAAPCLPQRAGGH